MKPGLPEAVLSPVLTFLLAGLAFAPFAFAKPKKPAPQGESPVENCVVSDLDDDAFPQRRLSDLKGKLRPPVTGRLVRRFGEEDPEGRASQGVVLRTRPGAQVVAPFDSVIMFAQPRDEFSQLLILSTGDGYHFVLAGMTKIYGVERQRLLEGEPVGVMGAADEDIPDLDAPRAAGTGDAVSADAGPELYFEIRENGKPIDPLPWLATARLERTSQ